MLTTALNGSEVLIVWSEIYTGHEPETSHVRQASPCFVEWCYSCWGRRATCITVRYTQKCKFSRSFLMVKF